MAPAPTITPERRVRPARWWWAPAGLLAGLALGAMARGWMRLLTDDPEFTWSGTFFIVGAFGVAGLGCTLAEIARSLGWRRPATTVARVVGAVLVLPLFTGAGSLMLPTVAIGSIATWRPIRRWVRNLLIAVAVIPVLFIGAGSLRESGLTIRTAAGLLAFIATYVVVVVALRSVVAAIPSARSTAHPT